MATEEEVRMAEAQARKYELEYDLASLRSHERHMSFIYGVRLLGLIVAIIAIAAGAWMVFAGLQGSFNWAVESPHTISSKLTNASPGIGFAMVGMIVAFIVILQKPVNYKTGGGGMYLGDNDDGGLLFSRRREGLRREGLIASLEARPRRAPPAEAKD
jgi:hypothetical protein